MEYLADLGAAAGQLGSGRLDVFHHQLPAVSRTRRGRGDSGPDDDRARRARRCQLHHPEVRTGGQVGILLPPSALSVESTSVGVDGAQRKHGRILMRATLIYGAGDIRVEDVPDPVIQQPTDPFVSGLRAAICGSDPWPRIEAATEQGAPIGHDHERPCHYRGQRLAQETLRRPIRAAFAVAVPRAASLRRSSRLLRAGAPPSSLAPCTRTPIGCRPPTGLPQEARRRAGWGQDAAARRLSRRRPPTIDHRRVTCHNKQPIVAS